MAMWQHCDGTLAVLVQFLKPLIRHNSPYPTIINLFYGKYQKQGYIAHFKNPECFEVLNFEKQVLAYFTKIVLNAVAVSTWAVFK